MSTTDHYAEAPAPVHKVVIPDVLIVDDTEANIIALRALLEDLECQISVARSGNEALRLLLKRDFAVMLLDVQMPEMDGYEVARHARQNPATRDVPIIFVTATHDSEDNVLRGYGSGAVDFLFKPVSPTILRSKVRIFTELYVARRQIGDAKSDLETAYLELQRTQAQLVQSAKMASLGELVAGVAHEINNPLAFTLSHLDTVKRSLEHAEREAGPALVDGALAHFSKAQNRLGEMNLGLERIRDLVLKLRTFSRLDEGERKHVSVHECVDSVTTILGHRLRDKIEVELELEAPDMLDCYPHLLNQALMNLVANAIDAIEDQQAAAGAEAPRGKLTIGSRIQGEYFVLRIADTGTGIPDHLRDRVLEPFFTTKEVGKGTGLGLSISYSIAKRHGGELELVPNEAGGTTAILRIPTTPASARGDANR
jgi:two-component system, NtrC family, sensor kinase